MKSEKEEAGGLKLGGVELRRERERLMRMHEKKRAKVEHEEKRGAVVDDAKENKRERVCGAEQSVG